MASQSQPCPVTAEEVELSPEFTAYFGLAPMDFTSGTEAVSTWNGSLSSGWKAWLVMPPSSGEAGRP